jgi:nucleoside-diphosphate-sugar epimerase
MNLLVTGASGFVGGKLVARARERGGWSVHGIGRRVLADPDYTAVDLTSPFDLSFAPDVVVHAAARSSPWGTWREFVQQNVDATRHVIDFCERRGRPRLVYISSSSVFYRPEHQFNLTEASPIGPRFVNHYAATKAAGEALVREYRGSWVILRPRAVFGPGDTVLFPRILKAARQGKLPQFATDGPPATGDLIYIDALTDYILRACAGPSIAGDFNLTNAEPVEIVGFLGGVFDQLGVPRPTRRIHVRTALRVAGVLEALHRVLPFLGEPPITRFGVSVFAWSKTFDVRKALTHLGPPSISLTDGVDAFVRWQKAQRS